jgi:hypothetical protein
MGASQKEEQGSGATIVLGLPEISTARSLLLRGVEDRA